MSRLSALKPLAAAALLATACSANAALLTATDSTYGAFDDSFGTRTFTLGSGLVSDVNISITFSKCNDPLIGVSGTTCNPGTPFNNEIFFQLTNPFGTTVNLITAGLYTTGENGSGRITINFDDEALATVGGATLAGGDFQPVGELSDFDGQNAGGNWILRIEDTVGADPLEYFTATLAVTTANAVPEPGSLALLGLGITGLAAFRRRRHA